MASFAENGGYGTKDKSRTGRVWAAEFHHDAALSRLALISKLINRQFL